MYLGRNLYKPKDLHDVEIQDVRDNITEVGPMARMVV